VVTNRLRETSRESRPYQNPCTHNLCSSRNLKHNCNSCNSRSWQDYLKTRMESNDHLCSFYHFSMSTPTVNSTYSYVTEAIPTNQPHQTINQPIPIQSLPQIPTPTLPTRAYTGTLPLCLNCTYHHPTTASCRLCTTCNRLGHFATHCRVNIHQYSTSTPSARDCYNCGDPDHFKENVP
jgi:hypothetical protein